MKNLKKIFENYWNLSEKEKDEFFSTIFTTWEIDEFWSRVNILNQILNKKTQREIAKGLWISITTVTRWSKVIKEKSEKIKSIFKNV